MANRPKKLLVVAHSLSSGGAERFASTLLCHLSRERFSPELCLIKPNVTYPVPTDVKVSSLDKQHPWDLPRSILRLRHLIEAARPDVILSTITYASQITGTALTGCACRPRWIGRYGNNPALEKTGLARLANDSWSKRSHRRMDLLVANSKGLAAGLEDYYPHLRGRVRTLYSPVDFSRIERLSREPPALTNDGRSPVILSVGRLIRQKRLDLLIECFSRVQARHAARLWICGEGPERSALERAIVQRDVRESVNLLGFQDNPFSVMRQASFFVLTSDFEGLPNALIEAQGLGLPAVSTRCPYGPDEIIEDGKTGLLTQAGDVDEITESIQSLLSAPAALKRMSNEAQRLARARFALDTVLQQWEEALLA